MSNKFGRAIVRISQEPAFMYVRSQVATSDFTFFDRLCLEPELNRFIVLSVPRGQLVGRELLLNVFQTSLPAISVCKEACHQMPS